jgi:glycosyltransferase involved in cell wall biosynthesis/GT2 family glycosyltransferase
VIVPFAGDRADASATLDAFRALKLRDGDELIVADNSVDQVFADPTGDIRVVAATTQRSSYYARNIGAEAATAEWLLFIDADCLPRPDLLDVYLRQPVPEPIGLMGGPILSTGGGDTLAARWGRSRESSVESFHLDGHPLPAVPGANLMVRRSAWGQVGGFQEGIRSAGDIEFCWRVQEAGWRFRYSPEASVEHAAASRLRPLLRRTARHGAGRRWLNRRENGWWPGPSLSRGLLRGVGGALIHALALRPERARLKLLDTVALTTNWLGSLGGNGAERPIGPASDTGSMTRYLYLSDAFPALSETFVSNEIRELLRLGKPTRVESSERPDRPDRQASRELAPRYLEDDGILYKLVCLTWLFSRHPYGCLRDLVQRRRWKAEEGVWPLRSLAPIAWRIERNGDQLIHVHFAGHAALTALRLSRLLGIPWTLAAHAYDIFQAPCNLEEKVRDAAFVAAHPPGLDHLNEMVGGRNGQVRRLIHGVDPVRLRRKSAYPGGGELLAVGRLVEKKGFGVLIDAIGHLGADGGPVERLRIVGDGPLRAELERSISEHGLQTTVELLGWREPDDVIELLDHADLLVMPSVIAADGDRDSMPMVVKEAMAMEVPVVASEEVGLPEFVRDEWGRLVPPGDPVQLAAAIEEVLSLSRERRIEMGQAGREYVLAQLNARIETARLAGWFEAELAAGSQQATTGAGTRERG